MAAQEVLASLSPDKRQKVSIAQDGDTLQIANNRLDRSKGGITMSGTNAVDSIMGLTSWISDEGLWGNNDVLNTAINMLNKRASYFSDENIRQRSQQAFAEGDHRGFVSALRTGSRTYNVDLVRSQSLNVPRSPSVIHDWLSGTKGVGAEIYGAQSMPGTIAAGTGAVWNIPKGTYGNSFKVGSQIVSAENLSNGSRFVFDAKSGMLDVATSNTLSSRLQMTSGALAAAKATPLLSLVGTTLEYGAYAYVGDSQLSVANGKSTIRDFAVDATLDLSKSVVAGAVGGGVGAAVSSAWAGAAIGSSFPGVGTVVGFAAGFAIGVGAAWAIEQGYDYNKSRESFKRWLNE